MAGARDGIDAGARGMAKGPHKESPGRQVDKLVAGLDIEAASHEDVAQRAEAICALGQDATERLARGILRPGPARREKVAALLACLSGRRAMWALDELRRILASRPLSPMERVWLLATVRSLEEAAGLRGPAAAERAEARPASPAPNEADLLLWREELAGLRPNEQAAALAPILETGEAGFLPLLEMALSLGEPKLDAAVADGLARFPHQDALPLLRELLRRPDPAVRGRARWSLAALERQGLDVRRFFVAEPTVEGPVVASLATAVDGAGHVAVLLARRGVEGLIHYAFVALDTLQDGIVRAWGERDLTEAELDERIADYSTQSGMHFDRVGPEVAQALVAAAEDFARERGRALSADYVAWRRIIGRPTGPARLPVVFGPRCTECGTRMRRADLDRGGLVASDLALCAACAARPRQCVACGRPLHAVLDDFHVRHGSREREVDFVCASCANAQRGRRK
jgi:hypothetical protein